MKKIFIIVFASLFAVSSFARQQQAKDVLDRTVAAFCKAGGIRAEFGMKTFMKGRVLGETMGVIRLKGEKFVLETPDATTWFDGETQWSYYTGSDEVNISVPAPDELQSINPYVILFMYQDGFDYTLGSTKTFRGRSVHEVTLTSTNREQNITCLTLYVAKDTYQPVYIVVELRDGSLSQITVNRFQGGQNHADSLFVFDREQYPHVEIIDLR